MGNSTVAEKFTQLSQTVESSRRLGPIYSKTLIIGGNRVLIRASDELFLTSFVSPFSHLALPLDQDETTTAYLNDVILDIGLRQQFANKDLLIWPWELNLYEDATGIVQFDSSLNVIRGHNFLDKRYVYVFDSFDAPLWTRPEYSRPIIELVFSRMNLTSVHGGTLGRSGNGVLITAKGGSGKSSLITAGVSKGLQTIGDDFQFLETSPQGAGAHTLWSLYHCVKLGPSSPAWPYLNTSAPENPPLQGMEKYSIDLLEKFPGNVVHSQRVVALVVPSLGHEVAIEPLSKALTLTALLPTSLGMSTRKRESALALTNLVESLPCYSLTVNHDLDSAINEIETLLAVHSPTASDGV